MTTGASSVKSKLQWASVILILISVVPCALVYINIPPIIQFAIDKQGNQGLQLYLYLFLASCPIGIALLLLVISLFMKDKP